MTKTKFRTSALRGLTVLSTSVLLVSCVVPERHYNEAVEGARAEASAHQKTAIAMVELNRRLERAETVLANREADLLNKQVMIERKDLSASQLAKERDDAALIVDQLRGELGRVGDHLRAFSDQKNSLAASLDAAEERLAGIQVVADGQNRLRLLVRDLTLAIHAPLVEGHVVLGADDQATTIRIPIGRGFDGDGGELHPEYKLLLRQIASVVAEYPELGVEIAELPTSGERLPEELIVRLQRIADELQGGGLSYERGVFSLPTDAIAAAEPATEASEDSWKNGPGSLELKIKRQAAR